MMFNLENDLGDRIACYVVPDAFASVASIRIVSGGKELLSLAANGVRPELVSSGRHETGQCGFFINTKAIPNLKNIEDLAIYEVETGTLVYRRPRPENIQKKILRLETHLLPLWTLDEELDARFQYSAKGIERLGAETITQMFLLNKISSVYLSGRVLYKNYSYYIEGGFKIVLAIQDPYEELAERLLVLSQSRRLGSVLNSRDSVSLRTAIAYAEHLVGDARQLDDLKELRRKLRLMPNDVFATLSNPLTRELTASNPDDLPGRHAIASALDVLSTVAVLGLRKDQDAFLRSLAAFLEVDQSSLSPMRQLKSVPIFAAALRDTKQVDALLEKDVELYQYVVDACSKASSAVGG